MGEEGMRKVKTDMQSSYHPAQPEVSLPGELWVFPAQGGAMGIF